MTAHIMKKKSSKIRMEKSEDRIKGTKTAVATKLDFRGKSCDDCVNAHSGIWLLVGFPLMIVQLQQSWMYIS